METRNEYIAPRTRVVPLSVEHTFLMSDFDTYGRNGDPIGTDEDDLNW